MTAQGRIGIMATMLTALMIGGCAETTKQAPPPPPAQPMATKPTPAQEKMADDMKIVREKVHADKKLLVSMNMELTEAEAQRFWPVYDQYQIALDRFIDRNLEFITNFASNYETMTDAVAQQLLDDYLMLDDDLLALKQAYLPKFREVLPERKVARYYQIENKIEAVYNLDLAANIPLVQ